MKLQTFSSYSLQNNFKLLSYYSKNLSWRLILILVTSIIIGSYPSALAFLFTKIVDNITIFKAQNSGLFILTGAILGIYSLAALCEVIKFFAVPNFIANFTCRIREDLHENLLKRSYLEINADQRDEGKQSVTFLRDLTIVEEMLHRILDVSTIYISRIVACFTIIFYYSFSLGLLLLFVFLAVQFAIWNLNRIYAESSQARANTEDEISTMLSETRDALEVLHYYNADQTLRGIFLERLKTFQHKLDLELRYISMSPGIPRIIFRAFICIIIAIACFMVVKGTMSVGELTGLIAIGTNIVDPLQEINIAWSKWTRASISLERIERELPSVFLSETATDLKAKISNPETIPLESTNKEKETQEKDAKEKETQEKDAKEKETIEIPFSETASDLSQGVKNLIESKTIVDSLRHHLYFQDISFGYQSSRLVLKNFDLTLPSTGLFWVKGANGSGKSTLFRLLSGDVVPSTGELYWDGCKLTDFSLPQRRRMIRVIPQRVFLFDMSIIDNLLIGNPDKTEQDILNVFDALGLSSFIDGFSDGLSTRVGRQAAYISGGQAQIICLVRALLSEPEILLLDEPFAAIDAAKSDVMLRVLKVIAQHRLLLLIAHDDRLAQFINQTILLRDGTVQLMPSGV